MCSKRQYAYRVMKGMSKMKNQASQAMAKAINTISRWMILACMLTSSNAWALQDEAWGPPYRIIYGGYSMKSTDWAKWEGVFNLVHHSLIDRDAQEVRYIFDNAAARGMKILTTLPIYDVKTDSIDTAALEAFVKSYKDEPALFGYVYEAAYRIPPKRQLDIYNAVKKIDPTRPVWSEFSSTSHTTWKRLFNPDACDALFTYNYPYEVKDRGDMVARIRYSVLAVNAAKKKRTPIVPILQAFEGTRWKAVPVGGMRDQLNQWIDAQPLAGVAFYRWRGNAKYQGLLSDMRENTQMWQEAKALCEQVAEYVTGDYIDAGSWQRIVKRSAAKEAVVEAERLADTGTFEGAMLLDQDNEDLTPESTVALDWEKRGGSVISGGVLGSKRAIQVTDNLAFRWDLLKHEKGVLQTQVYIKPTEDGYAKGMVGLHEDENGYLLAGVRLGHGSGANSNTFSYFNQQGKWQRLGMAFVPDKWYLVTISIRRDDGSVTYVVTDVESGEQHAAQAKTRQSASQITLISVHSDHAESVIVDEIRVEVRPN